MNRALFVLTLFLIGFSQQILAQSNRVIGPVEKRMADSVCNSVNKLDVSKITSKEEAIAAYTQCIGEHIDLLNDLATERKVDITDEVGMKSVGIDLAFDLYKMKCDKFLQLSKLMAIKKIADDAQKGDVSLGTLKRIDQKGFNYFVIVDGSNNEKSFIWLRQFPGSEKFVNGITPYIGKKIKITWVSMEVYLPQSKGYYDVKEVTGIDLL